MALNKQKISVPFVQGLNTKPDDKQRTLGSLERVTNVSFTEPGKLKKRNGYDEITTELLAGSSISSPQKITTFKDELCVFNPTNFYSYSESTEKWTNKGTVSNIFPTSTPVIRNTYQQFSQDSAHVSDMNIFAWEDTRGGVRVSVIDHATGNELISDEEITSSGTNPRVEYIGTSVYFFYIDGTDIKYRKLKAASPSSIESEVTAVSGDLHASNKIYDTSSISNRVYISYNSSTATLKIKYLPEDEVLSATQEEAGESPSTALTISADEGSRVLLSYYNGTEVKVIVKNFSLTSNLVPPTIIETIANITRVTIGSANSTMYTVYYEESNTNTYDHNIRKNTIDISAVVGTPADFIRSCGLASKIFVKDDCLYITAVHESTLQNSTFILNEDAEVVSKISPQVSGGLLTNSNLPKVTTITESTYLVTSQIKSRTISEENTLFSLLGINSTILDFDNPVKFDNASLGDNLHTTGGVVQSYDGKQIVEHGFHLFPENIEAGSTATTGGFLSDGTYQFSALYTWVDNQGNEHRSAPSIPISVTLSGGTATQIQNITIPTLRITEKSNVVIDLYRTEAAGTVFYKVTSVASPNYNDTTVSSISIQDTISDSSLISNEVLYTTGEELENISAPAASIIETFQNRVFLAGLEDENKIQYSKIRFEGKPVEFNDTLVKNINSRGGKIKALAALDDKLIIFKETAIYFLSGDGPNNQGEQDTFIEPELISSDVGCETQNSIVRMPAGLMFKSKKGIYLLSRNLDTQYIGAPVEDFNDLTIKSATFIPKKNQVRFITNEQALVFDYFVAQWTLYTNHQGISSTTLNDDFYYIRDNNEIYKENNLFTDNGSPINISLETAWISMAGVQGFQRIYRALVLGEYKSPHKLTMKVGYNFIDSFTQEKVIDTSDFTTDTIYGEDSPYGTGTPYGGAGNQYQVRLDFKTQKCQSFKIKIVESQSDNFGEGLELSNILLVLGAKSSEFKPSQGRVYGTS